MKKRTDTSTIMIFMIYVMGIFFGFTSEVTAQDPGKINPKMDSIQQIKIDSLKPKDVEVNKKLLRPFKRKRDQKEQDRIVAFLEKYLKIDPTTARQVSDELIRLTENQAIFEDYNLKNNEDITTLESEIKNILRKLDRTAQVNEVEDIAKELALIQQGMADELEKEQIEVRKEIRAKVNEINSIDFQFDTVHTHKVFSINDSTLLSLQTKMRVFGWQSADLDSKISEDYNFNFLTDIIYHGYELRADGKVQNEKMLDKLLIDGSLSALVRQNRIKLSLSVYSKNSTTVSAFLENTIAQDTLISQIKLMRTKVPIEGINIYFDNFSNKVRQNFTAFVKKLKQSLEKDNPKFLITVSLPPISNEKSKEVVRAYDLESLSPLVDYFLIQTNKVKPLNDKFPGSPSPLFKLEEGQSQSIESTLDYYANGKIPAKQMVMTISYLGLNWTDIDNISLHPANRVSELGFIKIRDYFKDSDRDFYLGYDAVQESPYYTYYENGRNQQLWFEDGNSLYKKYNFAVNENLGGVAIWGLGTDGNNTDLWNALGAGLAKIDTIKIASEKYKKPNLLDHIKLYFSDLMWASPNDITIGADAYEIKRQKETDSERYCMWAILKTDNQLYTSFKNDSTVLTPSDLKILRPKTDSLGFIKILASEDSVKFLIDERRDIIDYLIKIRKVASNDLFNIHNPNYVKIYSRSIFDYLPWFEPDIFVDSVDHCTCLALRWEKYADLHIKLSITFFLASLIVFIYVFWKTMRKGEEGFHYKFLFQSVAIILFAIAILLFLGYLYFDIHFTYFGAASSEVPIWVLALILILGFILGAVYRKIKMARIYEKKDLP